MESNNGYSIQEVIKSTGSTKTKLLRDIKSGKLEVIVYGNKKKTTIVTQVQLDNYLKTLHNKSEQYAETHIVDAVHSKIERRRTTNKRGFLENLGEALGQAADQAESGDEKSRDYMLLLNRVFQSKIAHVDNMFPERTTKR